jgi:hypothetical protein
MNREDIMRMAEASGVEDSLLYEHWRCNVESMTRFAELVASAERDAILAVIGDNQCECRCSEVVRDRGQA